MTARPIGSALDAAGVRADLAPDTLISGAVVILRTVHADGTDRLSIAGSDGLGWIDRLGMMHLALAMQTPTTQPGA